jgi:TRAP-type C4-dicarboxylate transport system permease small subunit
MSPEDDQERSTVVARLKAWCIIFFGIGCLLSNYPLLQLWNQPADIRGIPMMILYLHVIWAGGIFFLFVLMKALGKKEDK